MALWQRIIVLAVGTKKVKSARLIVFVGYRLHYLLVGH